MEPLVSCLMVTQASRAALALRAIRAFNRQTYACRELVIVSIADSSGLLPLVADGVRVVSAHGPAESTLGDLRNLSIALAAGELIATWDDDDWSHPDRLARQISALQASDAAACVLAKCIFAREAHDEYAVVRAWPRTGYASMVAKRAAMPRYPSVQRGEDAVLRAMNVIAIDEPHLYVRTLHGANTCDVAYALSLMRGRTSAPLSRAEVARLKTAMSVVSDPIGAPAARHS
jgi:glycosyltransferase involved in cell wall biosynthesis